MQKAGVIQDFYGRRYRIGESDRSLLGRPRGWMLGAAWAAMLAAGAGQYGYGALLPMLVAERGWTWQQGCWVLALWTVCQSASVYPAARAGLRPAATLAVGAVLCASGFVALAGSGGFAVVLVSHSVLGGIGAGLVYGTCVSVIARWYPERSSRVALTSGAFAYGAIPFLLLGFVPAAIVVLVLAGAGALVLRNPPEHWWPQHVDPRRWALDKTVNPSLRRNRPPIRQYSITEVVRCPASRQLYFAVLGAAAVLLFDIAYLSAFDGVLTAAVFAGASGIGRAGVGWAGARFGRRNVLCGALVVAGLAQLLVIGSLAILGACLAGAACGACYALLPGVVEGHFGERLGLPNFGLFYGAKAAGGLVGVLLAAYLGGAGGFVVAAVLGVVAAALVASLRQPGRPAVAFWRR
ncbi:MFS transporter [Amycolatopsis alkalitolerans]|uniref:OFA family MFS transporter n=1 Tax=Amycolatopsis alkalitolerans TaxID=2547244 RepID=A0A5C4LYL1_9PSEU|nr:OFA family MFS transporter [Amycolatopsis alkalitolerans]TNC23996.1 OFA family MFS transporter [Amycolatopsis alkalitolerans]